MKIPPPTNPKIYHIVHVDRLASIVAAEHLFCDATIQDQRPDGTTIGMSTIKQRRLTTALTSHPGLHVGDCVPFYFCPRSVMLYMLFKGNSPDLSYAGGQTTIIHLEADLRQTVAWANEQDLRWAFTLSNAGAFYFEDRCDLDRLDEIDWAAVRAQSWVACKEGKQAEFLVEKQFPWSLVQRIGVHSRTTGNRVTEVLRTATHKPLVETKVDWYY
jgi:hypothetical protein